jgi:hypothetical protein
MDKARKQAEKKEDVQAVAKSEGWHKVSDDEIWHVGIQKDMGYGITQIFNFSAQTMTQIARNLETGAGYYAGVVLSGDRRRQPDARGGDRNGKSRRQSGLFTPE